MPLPVEVEQNLIHSISEGTVDHVILPGEYYRHDNKILITRHGLRVFLHRHLYRKLRGPLESWEFLLPTCSWDRCQNPYHYEVSLSPRQPRKFCRNGHRYTEDDENPDGSRTCQQCLTARRARRLSGGLTQWERQVERTHCPYGHPYVADNTYEYATETGVRRHCKTCITARNRGDDPASVDYVPRT